MPKWTPTRIRKLRKDLELTQEEFAKRLGITKTYVYLIERGGEKKPSATLSLLLDCVSRERR